MVCMWLPWVCTGEIADTTGQSRRVEAIQIDVNSMLYQSVMYKVHLENIGWTDWFRNGEVAGTTGQSRRLEALILSIN